MGAIPFVAGLIGMLLLGWNSDRICERRWHFAIPTIDLRARCSARGSSSRLRTFCSPNGVFAWSSSALSLTCRRSGRCQVHFFPLPLQRAAVGLHQLHGQHRRIFWTQDHRRPEPAHGLVPRRIRLYDRLLDYRVTGWCAAVPAGKCGRGHQCPDLMNDEKKKDRCTKADLSEVWFNRSIPGHA